jgi:carboxylesterase
MINELKVPVHIAYRLSSYSAAKHFGLKRLGLIAPGKQADIVLLRNLEKVEIAEVFIAGTSIADLDNVNWQQWPAEIESHVYQLLIECEKVFLCGFSMGAAASLHVASRYQSQLTGLILVNPMIHRKNVWPSAVKIASRFIKSFGTAGSDIKRGDVIQWKYDRTPMRAAHQLLRLLEETRPLLPTIKLPLLLFRSVTDHTLPASNSELILNSIGSNQRQEITLHNSYHVAPLDHDQEIIFTESLRFIRKACE